MAMSKAFVLASLLADEKDLLVKYRVGLWLKELFVILVFWERELSIIGFF